MVGGAGPFSLNNQFNRAWQARRQPGSSFKAYVYTAAIDSGMTPTIDRRRLADLLSDGRRHALGADTTTTTAFWVRSRCATRWRNRATSSR